MRQHLLNQTSIRWFRICCPRGTTPSEIETTPSEIEKTSSEIETSISWKSGNCMEIRLSRRRSSPPTEGAVLLSVCPDGAFVLKCKEQSNGGFFFQIRKCKEDFVQALSGIQTVTTKFLNKIDNLFPHSLTFHLTCKSQKEQLETIKSNCTNLSRDVENKFQPYLDHVGEKVRECRLVYPKSIKRLKKPPSFQP